MGRKWKLLGEVEECKDYELHNSKTKKKIGYEA